MKFARRLVSTLVLTFDFLEHLGIAVALEVPFFVVITKVDMVPEEQLKKISDTVTSVLKSAGATKVPLRCRASAVTRRRAS